MGLNKLSWGLTISAVLLGVGVMGYEYWSKEVTTAIEGNQPPGLVIDEAQIKKITIDRPSDRVELVPSGDNLQPWLLGDGSTQQPANTAAVSYLLNLLTSPQQDNRSITINPDQRETYGLATPIATIEVQTPTETYRINLGTNTFNGESLYAEVTGQSSQPSEALIVKVDWRNAALRPREEWIGQTMEPLPESQ